MGELTVLTDGTIRYADGTKSYIELPRSSWSGNLLQTRSLITNWLTANKLTGWTVTVNSIGIPPSITITSSSARTN
jgi:hypothetical protein